MAESHTCHTKPERRMSDLEDIWIQTASGRVFHPFDPREEEVSLEDIATSLGNICRYNGHLRPNRFYSVAEHSLLLARHIWSETLDSVLAQQALLHDAAEAYIGDIPRPIKQALPDIERIEAKITRVIFAALGVPWPIPEIIKDYDTRILLDEKAQALLPGERAWSVDLLPPLGVTLQFMPPILAGLRFEWEFFSLTWGFDPVRGNLPDETGS